MYLTWEELAVGAWGRDTPFAFVTFDDAVDCEADFALPPFPLIGLDFANTKLTCKLDTFVESGFDPEKISIAVTRYSDAGAILIQTLRALEHLPMDTGLTLESLAYATLQAGEAHKAWVKIRKDAINAPWGEAGIPASQAGDSDHQDEPVLLSRSGDDLDIVMNRPATGNAIDRPMRDALYEALQLVNCDPSIRKVTLKARGKAFSLGADLTEFGTTVDPVEAHRIRCLTLPARQAVRCRDKLHVEIDGACVGSGLELAAFASHITATRRSWFQLPELAMGIIPGAGGCVSLTHRIGRQRTALLVLSGRRINAAKALEWGLIDAVVDDFSA